MTPSGKATTAAECATASAPSQAAATAEGEILSAVVPEEMTADRLDRVLARLFADQSRSRLKALIEDGRATVDGRPVQEASHKVKGGQVLVLSLPPTLDATPQPQAMGLAIVYEDAHLIVIDKPAGLVVHPAPGNQDHTLVNALLAHCGDSLTGIGGVARPGIVHRIDKDTSGLLVVAKTALAHAGLSEQFAAHTVDRAYHAVVWGVPAPAAGEIEGNIGRSPPDRKKMTVLRSGGRTALTRYRTLQRFGLVAALIECRLATGRTHQIRVHMAHRGHPLMGDPVYGRGDRRRREVTDDPRLAAALSSFHRQALHAVRLGFVHPATGTTMTFDSPISEDLTQLIRALEAL